MDEILLTPYNPDWAEQFANEARRIKDALTPDLAARIEHFGSTAVPGLDAKPIIDMLVGTSDLSLARRDAPLLLEALGYAFWYDNPDPNHLFFVKGLPPNGPRTHHIHLIALDSPFWERLRFRDYLRDHPDEAARYLALKRDLAARFPDDREAYTNGKSEYIAEVMEQAEEWREQNKPATWESLRAETASDLCFYQQAIEENVSQEPEILAYEAQLFLCFVRFIDEVQTRPALRVLRPGMGHMDIGIADGPDYEDFFAVVAPLEEDALRLNSVDMKLYFSRSLATPKDGVIYADIRPEERLVLEGTPQEVCDALEKELMIYRARKHEVHAAREQLKKFRQGDPATLELLREEIKEKLAVYDQAEEKRLRALRELKWFDD